MDFKHGRLFKSVYREIDVILPEFLKTMIKLILISREHFWEMLYYFIERRWNANRF